MKIIIRSLLISLGLFTAGFVHAQTDATPPSGTFYLQSSGADSPPLPFNPYGDLEPVETIDATHHIYLVEDSTQDYADLQTPTACSAPQMV